MPLIAATEAARLSSAPMMDGGDLTAISNVCAASCAAKVHVSIERYRAASQAFRSDGRCWSRWRRLVFIADDQFMIVRSQETHSLLKAAVGSGRYAGLFLARTTRFGALLPIRKTSGWKASFTFRFNCSRSAEVCGPSLNRDALDPKFILSCSTWRPRFLFALFRI